MKTLLTTIAFLTVCLLGYRQAFAQQPTFNCNTGAGVGYLFQDLTTDVYTVNLLTGAATLQASDILGPTNGAVNAIGYNLIDNYMWGHRQGTNELVRIGSDFSVQTFTIPGLPTNPADAFYIGDISSTGVIYLYNSNTSGSTITRVDLNPSSPTYLTILPALPTTLTVIHDWAFSPIDGNLYAISGPNYHLYRFNPSTGARTDLGAVTGDGIQIDNPSAQFGAAFMDEQGIFYVSSNTTGRIYAIENPHIGGITAELLAVGPSSTANDGARCPLSAVLDMRVLADINQTLVNTPVSGSVATNDDIVPGSTFSVTSTTSNGTLVMNADGTYTYTPNPGFTGTDVAVYSACLPAPATFCKSTTLTITVTPFPGSTNTVVANNDNAWTKTNVPVNICIKCNDVDPQGNTIGTPVVTFPPAHGSVVINPDGTITYTPSLNYEGADSLVYSVCDNGAPQACDVATVYLHATNRTDNVTYANDDAAFTPINTPVNGNVSGNDTDPEGNTVTFTQVSQPANGVVAFNPDGTYTYTPNNGFTGPDRFTYSKCDNGSPVACDTATVYIAVQSTGQPSFQCEAGIGFLFQSATTDIYSLDLLTGDAVLEASDILGTTGFTEINAIGYNTKDNYIWGFRRGTNEVARVGSDGSVQTFPIAGIPITGDFFVGDINSDGVLYLYNNGVNTTSIYRIDLNPASGTYLQALPVLTTIASNLTDWAFSPIDNNLYALDNGTLALYRFDPATGARTTVGTVSGSGIVAGETYGAAFMDEQGIFYVSANSTGNIYAIENPHLGATTSILLSNGPVSSLNDGARCPQSAVLDFRVLADINQTLVNVPVSGSVATNDDIVPGSNFTVASSTTNGTLVMNPDGTYTYTPNPGFTGKDVATYTVCTPVSPPFCKSTTLTIVVIPLPDSLQNTVIANNDNAWTKTNVPVVVCILCNDIDPEDDVIGTPAILTPPLHGTAVVNPDGTITYTPATDYEGADSLFYTICDDGTPVACDTAIVYLHATNRTDNVTYANDDANFTSVDKPVNGDVSGNDTDPEGDAVTFTQVTQPANGTVVFNPDGTYTYTPGNGYEGPDRFTYSKCDNGTPVACDTATVYILIVDTDPLPVTLVSFTATRENQSALLNWKTTAETNSDYFEVQRSQSGKVWSVIGRVQARGESSELVGYSFADQSPASGQNLYRLRMIDKDGTFAFSSIRNIDFKGKAGVLLYPNPVTDKIYVDTKDNVAIVRIQINDASGRVVYDKVMSGRAAFSKEIDVSKLPAGTYLVLIGRTNGTSDVMKIVKP